MAQADFWVRKIANCVWDKNTVKKVLKDYQKWPVYKYIKKSYKDIILAERIMFKTLGTEKSINRWWKPLMALLQLKS
jgi:hypothetical protein